MTIAIFSLQLPTVQNFVKNKLVNYLENKIHTKVQLDRVYVDFPNSLVMENLYLQGQDVDTLLSVKKFDVGLDIWQLTKSKADIKSIDLSGVHANVIRKPDGKFNFDYIINAFVTDEKDESPSKPFIISLDKIKLNDIYVSFNDQQAANNIKLHLNSFDTRVKKFDLEQNSYGISDINLDGLKLKLKQDIVKEVAKKVEEKVDSLNDQKPMKIELNGFNLTNFDIDYGDDISGMFAKVKFKDFKTRVKKLDLQQNSYAVDDILVNGLLVDFNQKMVNKIQENNVDKIDPTAKQTPLQIGLSKINLNDIKVNYGDENSKTFAKINLNEFETKVNKLDLENSIFDIENILLKDADIEANLFLSSKNSTSNSSTSSTPMNLVLNETKLENVKVKYNNTAERRTAQGMDFNHLDFSKLNLDLRNFKMYNNTFTGQVKSAEIKESKGLNIQKLTTNFLYANTQAYLKNLYLQTPKTILRDEVILQYNSIQQLTSNPENVLVNANIKHSKIGFADILNLVPTLRKTTPFDNYPNAILHVNTNVKGKVNDLFINNLQVSGLDDLEVSASGRVKNAMNPTKLFYDLNIKNFSTSSKTIYNLVPKNIIPNNIRIPSKLSVKGKAKGTTKLINTQLTINSTLGNAKIDAIVDMLKKDAEKYNVKAEVQHLDVGTLISNKDIGKVTAKLNAIGTSFNPEKMNTKLSGFITSANYNNYTYQNINLDAKINEAVFEAQVLSKDPNANLNLIASGLYKKELSDVKLNGNINQLDVQKLGFYNEPMIIAGEIVANFANLNPDHLNGSLTLKNFALSNTKDIFPLQEVNLIANSTADSNQLKLTSQVADLDLKGKFKLTQIFGSLTSTINQYYQFQQSDENEKIEPHQFFSLHAKIKDDELVRRFVPDLKNFETITLDVAYDADLKQVNVDGKIPSLTYGTNTINNGLIKISNQNDALVYELNIDHLRSDNFQLNKINLDGDIANNTINYSISTKDDKDITQFLVAGNLKTLDDITEISLNPTGLVLNYDQWEVGERNLIQLKKDGIVANNFKLMHNGSEILLQSASDKGTSPLDISIKDFKIETITEIIKKDDLAAEGNINGTAQIRDLNTNMTFNSDLTISDLKAFGNPIGTIVAKVNNTSPSLINADISLNGHHNDLKILGDYNNEASAFDLNLAINRLEMKTVQGFSMNQIKDTEGYLAGNLKITGTVDQPSVLGQLKFNEVGLTIAETGSNFRKIDDAIDFTNKGIEFNRFKINDNEGNSLTLRGEILTKTYRDFAFNLTANARDFNVVNSEKTNDAMMYGKLAINANLTIKGDMDLPKVNGNLKVTDDTNFTFVLPQSSPSLQEREGIVEFIDQDQITLNETIKTAELITDSKIKGLDVSVNIEVSKEAKTSIIIDKANGDFVEIQGEAELTGGMDPSGKMTLVGVYQVEKGAYELSVSLLKRRFDIQKGSSITWTGEPTAANLDITAIYKTKAAPIDLIEQQISGYSSSEMNMYKQRIPFNSELILKGELLKPEIKFNISMDKDNPSIATAVIENTQSKLDQLKNDEAEMNKQVFALLLLNRFIGENPFESKTSVSAETMALQSVSNILSQQLNNLADDLIEGVDIDLGLDTQDDYSSGTKNTRTDLNVAVSKRLLNDRLKVSVGSNFGLDGDARENENMTNIAGDITIDYSLSRDGRYMLRAYRKDEYQVALQGQIVETGVGFIITLDYDKFKEIFEKRRKNKTNRKKQKVVSQP
ncbi:translocation/assembly module TamB [Empedobacter sp. 189-2]|uniref:translocation/assembly module TamB domain-containing protein n=1 Tax=Empedobacter sp. 189-2 TaxID=2746724 RepID=UPI002578C4AF|nr:translocation/assembly module TamB [Empedobacter sp. 189-2]MDM1544078.1 translocation/assembly module TamB [Empedobacter sp. 189-2]